jgi:hypothetical protein
MDSRVLSWVICAAIAALIALFAYWSHQAGHESTSGPVVVGTPSSGAPVTGNTGITQMLSRTFTQNNPKQCDNDMTQAFLEQRFGSSKGSLDRCRRNNVAENKDDLASSITVQSVTVTGATAAAAFKANGGYYDGSVFTVRVVHEGGGWRLDALTNVQVDRAIFDQHLKNSLRQEGYLPAEQTCAIAKYDRTVSDDDLARSIVIGDSSTGVQDYAASCLSRPTLLRVLGEEFTASLRSYGFSGSIVSCVVNRVTHGVPTSRLRHLVAAGDRGSDGWARLGYEAARACLGSGSGDSAGSSTI